MTTLAMEIDFSRTFNSLVNVLTVGDDNDLLLPLFPERSFGLLSRQGYLSIGRADFKSEEGIDWESSRQGIARLFLSNPDGRSSWNVLSARRALKKYLEPIKNLLDGSRLNIVMGFLGNAFISGILPELVEASRTDDAVTVALVSFPHPDEGNKYTQLARNTLQELKEKTDAVCLIPMEQIDEYYSGQSISSELLSEISRRVFARCARAVIDLACTSGFRSPHFDDILEFFKNAGEILVGYGDIPPSPAGAKKAVRNVLEHPLHSHRRYEFAEQIIVSVCLGNPAMEASEYQKIGRFCREFLGSETDVIVGHFKSKEEGDPPWLVVFGRNVNESASYGFDYPVSVPPEDKRPPELPSYYKRLYGRSRKVGKYDF